MRSHHEGSSSRYEYSVCPWGAAKQDHTSLGNFKEWRDGNWHFGGGQYCAGHGPREVTVSLICGTTEELGEVDEPQTCKYSIELFTPAAC